MDKPDPNLKIWVDILQLSSYDNQNSIADH